MKVDKRNSVFAELKDYDVISKKDDFIEITEWSNGEGFDIAINDRMFQLTWGQFKAVKKLVKKLKSIDVIEEMK